MVDYYLTQVIEKVDTLIELTKEDIEDIKQANNDNIFNRSKIKDEVLMTFESDKRVLDNELVKLVQNNVGVELSELLDKNSSEKLGQLRTKLEELKEINKKYARLVIAVNEFYSNLFDKIFPTEIENYKKINPKSFSLLKVNA